jgi:hypothetical protein
VCVIIIISISYCLARDFMRGSSIMLLSCSTHKVEEQARQGWHSSMPASGDATSSWPRCTQE